MSSFIELSILHDRIGKLVEYYYDLPNNEAGGNLHIVLDDGNVGWDSLAFCEQQCEDKNDTLGLLIIDILMELDETELELLYLNRWGRND